MFIAALVVPLVLAASTRETSVEQSAVDQPIVALHCAGAARINCALVAEKLAIYADGYRVLVVPPVPDGEVVLDVALASAGEGEARACTLTLTAAQATETLLGASDAEPLREEHIRCAEGRDAERRIALSLHAALQAQIDKVLALLRDAPNRRKARAGQDAVHQPSSMLTAAPASQPASAASDAARAAPLPPALAWSLWAGAGVNAWDLPLQPAIAAAVLLDILPALGAELHVSYAFDSALTLGGRTLRTTSVAPELRVRWRALEYRWFSFEAFALVQLRLAWFRLAGRPWTPSPDGGVGAGARLIVPITGWLALAAEASVLATFEQRVIKSGDVSLGTLRPYSWTVFAGPLLRF